MTPSVGDRIRLDAVVVGVRGEVATLQLSDGQAVRVPFAHLGGTVEDKALRPTRKVAHAANRVPD